MEKMNDLRDLLKHEAEDLYSAEEQIIEALPQMIEKASNAALKNSLTEHLRVTEKQRDRLDRVLEMLTKGNEEENGTKKKKLLGLFGGAKKCKGMEGIISEGKKMMGEDMDPEVMDAAIIASAQKVEHYEICGYGTARSYASELGLQKVATLLEQTLDEEYDADDKLTFLAESRINKQAEQNETRSEASASKNAGREGGKARSERRQMEMEPVSKGRQRSEAKENSNERGGRPKSTAMPRGNSGRSSGNATKKAAAKTKTSSRTSEKRGNSGTERRTGSSRNR